MADHARIQKHDANRVYAGRYPRRNRAQRKQDRRQRVERRELAWLEQMGVPRNHQPVA